MAPSDREPERAAEGPSQEGGGGERAGKLSAHLESRLSTGACLRAGTVPAIELRAGMIIGEGSASWHIVRDLSARLPAMVLPRWLNRRSSPVAIDDVVAALLWAVSDAPAASAFYDLPGPEVLSHRALIARVAGVLGKRPAMLEVPVVTPVLSSYWIALVTRIELDLARELVQGLQADLIPGPDTVWRQLSSRAPIDLETAARAALADERFGRIPAPPTTARLEAIGRSLARVRRVRTP